MLAPFIHPLQICDVTKGSFWTGVKTKGTNTEIYVNAYVKKLAAWGKYD